MPEVTLTDMTVRTLKPVEGKRITYVDRSLKGFGVRVSPSGHASYVLVVGANRTRIKLGDVGVVKLADARSAARQKLAEKQLGINQHTQAPSDVVQMGAAKLLKNKNTTDGLIEHAFNKYRSRPVLPKAK
jgi:hypothetical protein